MKLKPVAAALLGAAMLAAASGCDFSDFGREDMLRPPKTMGDEAEIEKLIAENAPGGSTRKYPKRGANRSSTATTPKRRSPSSATRTAQAASICL